ncbi:MAG: hypothetical protein COB98_10960 [Flavobacteriaceae bacterium]|nr:MAG: hypothetical protein COB98_10960 [Flavobacteriaceae bacterium]
MYINKILMITKNLLAFFVLLVIVSCQQKTTTPTIAIQKIDHSKTWVDSIYKNMSLKEKVGQLFMVAAYSNRDAKHLLDLKKLVNKHAIGGLCFFQGGPVRQATITNELQKVSKVPMLIGIDAEWGLKMRLDSTVRFPYNMTLGAVTDNAIIQKLGKQQGDNCKRLGIHINFAPVVDINTNAKNPIIGVRSYGEDRQLVTDKALAFVKGLESTGVLACVKHFPGHGDTHSDSHKTLPTISFTAKRIDSVELYPFKKLFEYGVGSVMVAHLNVPSLESEEGVPSSLSRAIVTTLLQEKLNYKGLVITDALNMKGASNFKKPGDIDLAAFIAGNDILLFSEDPVKAIQLIMTAYEKGVVTEDRLAYSVKKILTSKYQVGLAGYSPIVIENLVSDLNKASNNAIYQELSLNAITLLKNRDRNMPFDLKSVERVAYVKFGDGGNTAFLSALHKNLKVDVVLDKEIGALLMNLKKYDRVIVSYHRRNYRLTKKIPSHITEKIERIAKENTVTFVSFSSLYTVSKLSFQDIAAVIIAYENSRVFQENAAAIIFGENKFKGRLPASINKVFAQGNGMVE